MEAGLYPIAGVADVDVTVDVVGEISCVSPGMAFVSRCVPRLPPEVLPDVDGAAAANPDTDEVAEPVPLGTVAAKPRDDVVVEVVLVGAIAVAVLGLKTALVESLL